MILQALKEYYDRKADDAQAQIAPLGFEWKEIPFLVTLDLQGHFVRFEDTREREGRQVRAHSYLVPTLGEKKGNGIKANLCWENIEYMFGIPVPTPTKTKPNHERVKKQHEAFCERLNHISNGGPLGEALRLFTENLNIKTVKNDPLWDVVLAANQNMLLAIQGIGPVTNNPELIESIKRTALNKGRTGTCLVSGMLDQIVKLEPPIKGVRGAKSSGAGIVAVNNKVSNGVNGGATPAFASYLKEQGANSPIGKSASLAYTTALNTLLRKDSPQKIDVGDATTVFWAARRTAKAENDLESVFAEAFTDNPDRGVRAVTSIYRSVQTGAFAIEESSNQFYVLGLAPNGPRIVIRFWISDTVEGIASKIYQHFMDTEIASPINSPKWQGLNAFLAGTANETKYDSAKSNLVRYRAKYYDVKPNLAGDTVRAILQGLPYPQTLLQGTLRRITVEQGKKDRRTGKQLPNVTFERAAIVKACINRTIRKNNPAGERELTVSLDQCNPNIGYRLGRLFAALEKIQQDASPRINSTIRDRFYGAASGTPVTVFANLMRLKNHHLAKLDTGRRINRERLISEIMNGISDFPAHLTLADQGRFAIGYYHQMHDLFSKKTSKRSE